MSLLRPECGNKLWDGNQCQHGCFKIKSKKTCHLSEPLTALIIDVREWTMSHFNGLILKYLSMRNNCILMPLFRPECGIISGMEINAITGVLKLSTLFPEPVNSIIMAVGDSDTSHFKAWVLKFILVFKYFARTTIHKPECGGLLWSRYWEWCSWTVFPLLKFSC